MRRIFGYEDMEDHDEFEAVNRLLGLFSNSAINICNLYFCRYGVVPAWIDLEKIDCMRAIDWLFDEYEDEFLDYHSIKRNYEGRKGGDIRLDNIYFYLFEDLMICFSVSRKECMLLYKNTPIEVVERMAREIAAMKAPKKRERKKYEISVLQRGYSGLDTTTLAIKRQKLPIAEHYNDDFIPVHEEIIKRLKKNNDKGIVLLHGKPGTGKTSYIRYLISHVRKPVIFMPPSLAGNITSPDLMNVLLENPNSIFVIEDAEELVIDRNQGDSSAVSALLNIADGLLSDCLNIQIVCSFNTDLIRVDNALLRQGRLIARYEFKALCRQKAQALSDKLGFVTDVSRDMTLAEIYHQDTPAFTEPQRARIGFS